MRPTETLKELEILTYAMAELSLLVVAPETAAKMREVVNISRNQAFPSINYDFPKLKI
jgi:hypothetical protein